MTSILAVQAGPRLALCADTALDLLTPDPISISQEATIQEAVRLLTDKGFTAAPVIDDAGHPVGVVSRSDLVVHQREQAARYRDAMQPAEVMCVADIMTPAVFSVTPETPAAQVVAQLLALNVHRLFVVDHAGVLIGVISSFDVLRALR